MFPSEVGSFPKGMVQFKVPLKPPPPDYVTVPPSTDNNKSVKCDSSEKELIESSEKIEMDDEFVFKVYSFYTTNLSRPLLKAIEETASNWKPTPLQKSIIPAALLGYDVSVITSCSRTAAFILPVLERLVCMPECSDDMTSRVLVLVPTMESGEKMIKIVRQLAQFTNVKVGLSVGDESSQINNPDIVIATPSTLIGHAMDSLDLENIKVCFIF